MLQFLVMQVVNDAFLWNLISKSLFRSDQIILIYFLLREFSSANKQFLNSLIDGHHSKS